jgi:hypothetical protein
MVAPSELDTDAVRDSVRFYGSLGPTALSARLRALEDEPDLETVGTLALAGAGVAGLVMGFLGSRIWRLLAWITLPLLFIHAKGRLQAPEDFLRSLGMRSRREILEEKCALKALRGDFRGLAEKSGESGSDTAAALEAVRA